MKTFEFTKESADELDKYVRRSAYGSLLQTWGWGELQEKEGRRVRRFGVRAGEREVDADGELKGERLVAAFQAVEMPVVLGQKFLYLPCGPVMDYKNRRLVDYVLRDALPEVARRQGAFFIRLDPRIDVKDKARAGTVAALLDSGYKKTRTETQPRNTIVVDLARREDDILAAMKSKWRYNIRLAGKRGVEVEMVAGAGPNSDDEVKKRAKQAVHEFYRLVVETTERDKFSAHEEAHYQNLLSELGDSAAVFLARLDEGKGDDGDGASGDGTGNGEVIAAIIVSFFQKTATYLHGASSYKYRRLMAPHLLQWEAMKEAKRRGMTHYDLYGVAPGDLSPGKAAAHPWAGITRFKEGFGGTRIDYIGQYEKPISLLKYAFFSFAKRLRG